MAEGGAGADGADQVRLPSAVKGLSLVSLFNDFASEMIYPLLPSFITGTLGGGALALGTLDGAADLAASTLRWVSGRLADRRGWRAPLILFGYGVAILVRPLIAVASAAWQVIGFRVLDRVGKGLRSPARDALIADLTPVSIRGRAFGFNRAADHLGAVAGSLAAWWLVSRQVAVPRVIAASALPGLVAGVVLWWVLAARRGVRAAHPAGDPGVAPPPFHPPALPGLLVGLAGLAFVRMPETLLLLRLQDVGVATALIPLLWAGLHVVRSASAYPGGWLTDRAGATTSLCLGTLLYALVLLALGRRLGAQSTIGLFFAYGLVAGITEPAERATVAHASGGRTGHGFGLYQAVVGVATLPVAIGLGWLYQGMGGPVALAVAAGASIVALGVWLWVWVYSRHARAA